MSYHLSVVIPVPPGAPRPLALEVLESLESELDIEVLVVEGRRVSAQRNLGVAHSKAELIYFLDDDSQVAVDTLLRGLRTLADPKVAAVGGPAVTRIEAGFLEKCFGEATASRLGMLHLRARDRPVGSLRRTDGEELTLCNLMVRRSWLERLEGLREELYPGEDVDLLHRLNSAGAVIIYDPEMRIHRPRRKTVGAFCRQHFVYGQARGLALKEGLGLKQLPFLVPTVFSLYVILWMLRLVPVGPLALYLVLCLLAGSRIAVRRRSALTGLGSVFTFGLLHLSFGLGVLAGLGGWAPPPGAGEIRICEHTVIS